MAEQTVLFPALFDKPQRKGTRPFLRCQGKFLLSMLIPERISNVLHAVVP